MGISVQAISFAEKSWSNKGSEKNQKANCARFKTNPKRETKDLHVNCAIHFASCYKWVSPAGNLGMPYLQVHQHLCLQLV